jgi:hypothetical protein
MATRDDVDPIARGLPGVSHESNGYRVCGKLFAWNWLERVNPKRARVPNPEVIAVRVANELGKQALLSLDPDVFFTEPHYDGYPAVLVRLPAIDLGLLENVLTDAWRCQAPKKLAAEFDPQGL